MKDATVKLSPAQQRAMLKLRSSQNGKIITGQGIALSTARVLHRLGVAFLEETPELWTLVLITPAETTVTDAELADLPRDLAEVLRPLDIRARYKVLRNAEIIRGNPQLSPYRGAATLAEIAAEDIPAREEWLSAPVGSSDYRDFAGLQGKYAREHVTDVWRVRSEKVDEAEMIITARTQQELADEVARRVTEAPHLFPRLVNRPWGARRLSVGDLVALRRAGKL